MHKTTRFNALTTRTCLAGLVGAGTCAVFAQGAPAPVTTSTNKPKWETSAALGFTLTAGNSETILLNGNILVQRKDPKNEISLGADGAYGETKDPSTGRKNVNVEYIHGFAQYNRLFTERLYGYARADERSDSVADIDYRVTLSPGAGYYFVKTPKMLLSGEAGPGFITERKGGVHSSYWTFRAAEKFEYKINDKTRIWQTFEYLPKVDDFNDYIINAEVGLETTLTKRLSLRTFLQDTYNSEPAPGRKANDLKWVTAIAYKFS